MSNIGNKTSGMSRYCVLMLILIGILTLIDGLDSTIVNISLKDIATALGCDMSWTSWIVIAYMLPTVGFIVLFGKVLQTRPIKGILVASTIIFGIASALCGMSTSIEMLVLFRMLQGISGAALLSAAPILIVRELPEKYVSFGMAVLAIVTGIATTVGPTVGALFTDTWGWESIFFINVPICAFLVVFVLTCFKDMDKTVNKGKMPNLSVCICYAFSTMAFVYVITMLEDDIDNVLLYVLLFAASIAAGVFVYRSCCRDESGHPLFRKTLLKNKEVILCTISFICTTITASIITYILPFYMRQALDVPAGNVGVLFGISSVITIVCSVIAGKWCQVRGCKTLTVTAILLRILFALIFLFIRPDMGMVPVYIALAVMGASFGFSGTSQPTRIVQHAGKADKEDASNIMLTGNYVGASLGVALCVIVIFVAIPGAYGIPVNELSVSMITDSMHYTALFSIFVNLIALLCTLKVRNIVPNDTEEEAVSQ